MNKYRFRVAYGLRLSKTGMVIQTALAKGIWLAPPGWQFSDGTSLEFDYGAVGKKPRAIERAVWDDGDHKIWRKDHEYD